MEYKVLTSESADDLAREVKDYLKRGWTLQGGVSLTSTPNRDYAHGLYKVFAQAMVKG